MPVYRVFGLTFASDHPFTYPLSPGDGPPDFTFSIAGADRALPGGDGVFTPPQSSGEGRVRLLRADGCDVLHCAGAGDFFLFPDRITCRPLSDVPGTIEAYFLSAVLAFWLERAGRPALHASAVVVNGGAVGFLSHTGNGKSGLAAALVQTGCPLLTDDILALAPASDAWLAQPGFAAMRLWPDEAECFTGQCESLPRVHPASAKRRVDIGPGRWGAFCAAPQPLIGLFVPQRRDAAGSDDEIVIAPITPRDAVVELARYTFGASWLRHAGIQAQRMDRLVDLARRVPVYRLRFPSGLYRLPRVAAAVAEWVK